MKGVAEVRTEPAAATPPAAVPLHQRLLAAIEPIAVRAERATRHRVFSDVRDDAGRQYVDLVLEGGGALGIALLGYVAILERCGIRFLGLGGVSAGSITACLLAAAGPPADAKCPLLLRRIASLPATAFAEDPPAARRLVTALLRRAGGPALFLRGLGVRGVPARHLGLDPGDALVGWLRTALEQDGVPTSRELQAGLCRTPSGLCHVPTGSPIDLATEPPLLKLFACDLATGTRVTLPAMASLFWDDADSLSPAFFVRAATAIPGFATPVVVPRPGACDDACRARWRSLAGFGPPDLRAGLDGDFRPSRFVLVDGGALSSFPVDAFHRVGGLPRRPTFGAKLQRGGRRHEIESPLELLTEAFHAAHRVLDDELIRKHPDCGRLVSFVDTAPHDPLDTGLSDDAKADLVTRGANAAAAFLEGFDWVAYKAQR